MRLIDADALKIDIEENSIVMEGVQSIEVECAKSLIDIAPTECEKYRSFCMAKQRPQGEWDFDSEYTEFGNPYGTYKCSCCGGHSSDKYPYCFWCGTKMKGGAE